MVLLLLFGGVIADRFPRSLVLQVSNLACGLTQGADRRAAAHRPRRAVDAPGARRRSAGAASALGFPAMAEHGAAAGPARAAPAGQRPARAVPRPDGHRRPEPGHAARRHGRVRVGGAGRRRRPGWSRPSCCCRCGAYAAPRRAGPPAPRRPRPRRSPSCARGGGCSAATTWLWVVVAGFGVLNAIARGRLAHPRPGRWPSETIGRQAWGWVLSAEAAGALVATAGAAAGRPAAAAAGRAWSAARCSASRW